MRRRVAPQLYARAQVRTPALAIAVVALVMPSAASAMVEVEKTQTESGTHPAVASCPPGKHVVSGGGWVHVVPSSFGQPPLNSSSMTGNGWGVTGFIHGNATFSVTAYAYCGANDLHLTPFQGNEGTGQPRATASVGCTHGSAVSGGGAMTATYGYMSAYAKLFNGWRTAADSRFDGGSSGMLPTATIATVNCTPERYVLTKASRSTTIGANRLGSAEALCPRGTAIVSGGGEAGGTNSNDYAFIYYSRLGGDLTKPSTRNSWRIDAESGSLSGTTVTAYAYCIRLPNTTITAVHVKSKKRRATFAFRGTTGEAGPHFQCSLDRKPFAVCTSPKTYKKLKPGQHTFAVRALDPALRVDPTPATRSFKIKKPKKTTQARIL